MRYIPVPTGNSPPSSPYVIVISVYPCTYRELPDLIEPADSYVGISLYLQGTLLNKTIYTLCKRYIPVPTGNSSSDSNSGTIFAVYPCTYRELSNHKSTHRVSDGISLYLQGTLDNKTLHISEFRYIPVPTGNSKNIWQTVNTCAVYPCTYRELYVLVLQNEQEHGISLYLQGTHQNQYP